CHRLVAVGAWSFPPDMSRLLPSDLDLAEDTQTMRDEMVERVFGENPPAHVTVVVKPGSPAQVLIDASESASMVVVGSRGHGGFVGMVLGSVGRAVAAPAKCPVAVAPGPAKQRQ